MRKRIKLLGERAVLPRTLTRFIEDSTHADRIKKVRGPLPGIASAFRCYVSICELIKAPLSPIRRKLSCDGSAYSAIHPPLGTIYRAFKRRVFPRHPAAWFTPSVRHVSKGIKKSQKQKISISELYPDSSVGQNLRSRVAMHRICASCFPRLFSFRVPPETPQLRRAHPTDDMAAVSPNPENALISANDR